MQVLSDFKKCIQFIWDLRIIKFGDLPSNLVTFPYFEFRASLGNAVYLIIYNFTKHSHLYKQSQNRSIQSLKLKLKRCTLNKSSSQQIQQIQNHGLKTIVYPNFEKWLRYYKYTCTNPTDKGQISVKHIQTLAFEIKIEKCDLPTFYWLPKLHKSPYKTHFI